MKKQNCTPQRLLITVALILTGAAAKAQGVYTGESSDSYDYIYTDVVGYGGSCGDTYVYSTLNGSFADGAAVYQTLLADPGTEYSWNWGSIIYYDILGTCHSTQSDNTYTLKITKTYYGPPPSIFRTPSYYSCSYTNLACSPGTTPTCTSGSPGIAFTLGCPDYLVSEWLVVNGHCAFSVAASASGPGACN